MFKTSTKPPGQHATVHLTGVVPALVALLATLLAAGPADVRAQGDTADAAITEPAITETDDALRRAQAAPRPETPTDAGEAADAPARPVFGPAPRASDASSTEGDAPRTITLEPESLAPIERAQLWVHQTQRDLHRRITLGVHNIARDPGIETQIALIVVAFLYGIFHAIGPGHGKVVISAYLLTHRERLARGIGLSFLASLFQGVTAVVLVVAGLLVLGWLVRDVTGQVRHLELASFTLIGLIGLWLVLRGLRTLWRRRAGGHGHTDHHAHDHHAHDHHAHDHHAHDHPAHDHPAHDHPAHDHPAHDHPAHDHPVHEHGVLHRPTPSGRGHGHDGHTHAHDVGCGCGKPHHVDPEARGPWWALVLSVGLRPCSGAVLLMAVAGLLGLWWTGVVAVLAMSLGTAITVAALATLAVLARGTALKLLDGPVGAARLGTALAVAGVIAGVFIAWVGFGLAWSLWTTPAVTHPLLR